MTIDEVIEQAREKADKNSSCWKHCASIKNCNECETENKQLAEWLEELKELRKIKEDYAKGMQASYATFMYNKALDDFVRFASDMPTVEEEDGTIRPMWLEEMAEQLKAGGGE